MSQAFVPGLRACQRTRVVKWRELPLAGELLVQKGDQVDAEQIVARASLPGDLLILRVPEELGIESFEVLAGIKELGLKEGDKVEQGQALCQHAGLWGLFKTNFNAPATGTIEFISSSNGHIGLRLKSQPLELKAYLNGTVSDLKPGFSVQIESEAALVQGIFGVGGEKIGQLKVLEVDSAKELSAADIPQDISGSILVGGTNPSLEALQKASQAGAVGMVVGSIEDQALKGFLGYDLGIALTGDEDLSMTLIVCEGFGNIALSSRVIDILSELDGSQVSINGATQVRAGAIRPEIIVFHDKETIVTEQSSVGGLEVGSTVRIIRVPYFGQRAEVVELPHKAEQIETGAYCRVLRARLTGGEVVTVARANVELV